MIWIFLKLYFWKGVVVVVIIGGVGVVVFFGDVVWLMIKLECIDLMIEEMIK